MNVAVMKQECKGEGCTKTERVRGYCQSCYGLMRYHGKLDLEEETNVRKVKAQNKSRVEEREAVVRSYARALTCYSIASSFESRMDWRDRMLALENVAHESGLTIDQLREEAKQLLIDLEKRKEKKKMEKKSTAWSYKRPEDGRIYFVAKGIIYGWHTWVMENGEVLEGSVAPPILAATNKTREIAQMFLDKYACDKGWPRCCRECDRVEDDCGSWDQSGLCTACAGSGDGHT